MADLITLQQYKDFAGLQGESENAKINVIIPAISQAVKTYCATSFIDYYSVDKTEYFDITDDLSWGERQNFCLLHSYERLRMYKTEKFDYKTYKIKI